MAYIISIHEVISRHHQRHTHAAKHKGNFVVDATVYMHFGLWIVLLELADLTEVVLIEGATAFARRSSHEQDEVHVLLIVIKNQMRGISLYSQAETRNAVLHATQV